MKDYKECLGIVTGFDPHGGLPPPPPWLFITWAIITAAFLAVLYME